MASAASGLPWALSVKVQIHIAPKGKQKLLVGTVNEIWQIMALRFELGRVFEAASQLTCSSTYCIIQ